MILPASRYSDSTVAIVTKGTGQAAVIVPSAQTAHSFTFISHVVSIGERVETIAYQYYHDATVWWKIADANPEILWWDDLAAGTVLRIPAI